MKLFLYCNRMTPYLVQGSVKPMHTVDANNPYNFNWKLVKKDPSNNRFNGKVVAECDFEIEKIEMLGDEIDIYYGIEDKACLTTEEIENYLGYDNDYNGYAIHIKNLRIFTYPKNLSDFEYTTNSFGGMRLRAVLFQAPKNMRKVIANGTDAILMPIKPQLLCKVLNGEKTIEVRKKVLKEMLKNG